MKKRTKRLLALLSVLLLTATLVTTLAIIPGAQSVTPELDIKYCNLSFNSTIYIKYAVESNVDDVELLVWTEPRVDDYPVGTEEHKITTYYKETINGKVYNIFDFTKLPAKRMADSVYARAHTKVNGLDYYSDVNKYSILQYAYNMKDRDDVAQSLKDLLNGILEYGKLAQKHFEHETDHLVTDSWYEINVNGGTILEDGSNHGLYLKGDTITLTAPAINNDMQQFIAWKDPNGVVISADDRLEIDVWSENETYTPFYSDLLTGGLEFTSNGDGTCYVSGIGTFTGSEIVLPNAYRGEIITGIGEGAFKDNTTITDVFIPDSVKTIGKDAFSGCTALKNLIIGDGVTTVGENAFMNTTALASVVIGDGMTSLDCFDFADNSEDIENVVIGNGIKTINDKTFIYCYDLERVVIGDKVESIGKEAFNGYYKLRTIIIPDSVKTIGENAFLYCTSLYKLVIGKNVERIEECAFYNCSSIDNVVIPDSVTYLGDRAFSRCTELNTLTLGKGLKKIEANPFTGRIKSVYYSGTLTDWLNIEFTQSESNPLSGGADLYMDGKLVTELPIPSGTTEVKQYAFYGCTSLTDVVLTDSVTSIGVSAFKSCPNLKSVTFGAGMTKMEKDRFDSTIEKICYAGTIDGWVQIDFEDGQCNPLCCGADLYIGEELVDELTIPSTTANIKQYAFYGCGSIKKVIVSSSTTIGKSAFESCPSLESANIAGIIGEAAFRGCKKLQTATVSGSIVGKYAFISCTVLSEVSIGDDVEKIESEAFKACTALTKVIIGTEKTMYKGGKLSTIGSGAFADCTNLHYVAYSGYENNWAQISFEDMTANPLSNKASLNTCLGTITTFDTLTLGGNFNIIKDYVFAGCTNLKGVAILFDCAKHLGKNVFEEAGVVEVVICDNIGDNYLFKNCKDLKKIVIYENVTSIGANVFSGCSGLETLTIPDNLISIGSKTFENCSGIKTLTLGNGLTTIASDAFSGCSSVETVVVGNKITSLDFVCFSGSLKSIKLGDGITIIPERKFEGYWDLETVEFGKNLTEIGPLAFYYAIGLSGDLVIPESVTTIGKGAFRDCRSLTSVTIGNEVTRLEETTFMSCTNLKSVTIGDKVTWIGVWCFLGCPNLETVVLPQCTRYIQTESFADSTKLSAVYYEGTEQEWNTNTNNSTTAYCYVFKEAPRYYYSETQPTESGNFWHYVNGVPTKW